MIKKRCSKCGTEKPLTTDFFHRGKDTKEGFKSACKECRSAEKKEWRDANKERINQQAKEYHVKNRDKRLEYSKEYHTKNRDKRLEYAKEYHQKNKEQRLVYSKEWAKRNPDKVREKSNRYRERHVEELKESQRKYRLNNKEKIRLRDKTRRQRPDVKEYYRSYKLRPDVKEKNKIYKQTEHGRQVNKRSKHKRRYLEREALATLTLSQWKSCLNYFDNKCAYCGVGKSDLTQEHFVPVVRGGEYTVKNIIPACGSCNFSKCAKDFFDWYPTHKFYSKKRERKILKYLGIKDSTQQISLF